MVVVPIADVPDMTPDVTSLLATAPTGAVAAVAAGVGTMRLEAVEHHALQQGAGVDDVPDMAEFEDGT